MVYDKNRLKSSGRTPCRPNVSWYPPEVKENVVKELKEFGVVFLLSGLIVPDSVLILIGVIMLAISFIWQPHE
jgi:hypothetical protein